MQNAKRYLLPVVAWGLVGIIIFSTLAPLGNRPKVSADPNLERTAAYFLTGALLMLAHPRRRMMVVSFIVVLAGGLELLQHFAINRHGRFEDFLVKVIGGLAGVGSALVLERLGRYLSAKWRR